MAEVRLPNLRIGFGYGADVVFPTGFLAAEESCRAKLRRWAGQAVPDAVFASEKDPDGRTIHLDLTAAQTLGLEPGSYITELVIYYPAAPATPEIALGDNTFRIEANYSPSI